MGDAQISAREAEVLDALADRLTNAEIAERLFLSVRTVEHHVSALLRKFGADNRRSLASIARGRRSSAGLAVKGRLPLALTSFVGREPELEFVANLLAAARLVTVVGPAGVGKTRLAVEVARRISVVDEAVFVDLTAATGGGAAVLAVITAAVGPSEQLGVSLLDALTERLGQRPAVLVLDNCEHVIESVVASVIQLLEAVPSVRVLATSREPLAIPGEHVAALSPLPIPANGATVESVRGSESVRLFADRALAAGGGFEVDEPTAHTVASICRRLDGIPLALELAAAQLPALTPKQIDARLGNRFRLLRGPARGRGSHHRTLEAAVAWSYDLLDARERALLDRLSVFSGTFTLESAEAVAAGAPIDVADVVELVIRLVHKSLVVPETVGVERRYRLLETMREFGVQRLGDARELAVWRERHREWIFTQMREAAVGLSCGVLPDWLNRLDDDLDNMEAALDWSMRTPERAAEALVVVRSLEHYWMARGVRRAHGVRWSTTAAEQATTVAAAVRVEGLLGAVLLVMWSDLHAARTLAVKATDLADGSGDPIAQGYACLARAWVAIFAGTFDDAAPLAIRARDLLEPTDPIRPWAGMALAMLRGCAGEHMIAARMVRQVADLFRANNDPHMFGAFLSCAADYEIAVGKMGAARTDVEESLHQARVADCASCESLALASQALLDDDAAARLATGRRALRLAYDIGEPWGALCALEVLVAALADVGNAEEAAVVAGATRAARTATGMVALLPARATALRSGERTAENVLGATAFKEGTRFGAALGYPSAVERALG